MNEQNVSGSIGSPEYDAEQLTAGFRSMRMLSALVQRGGRPAVVAPTIPLRAGPSPPPDRRRLRRRPRSRKPAGRV